MWGFSAARSPPMMCGVERAPVKRLDTWYSHDLWHIGHACVQACIGLAVLVIATRFCWPARAFTRGRVLQFERRSRIHAAFVFAQEPASPGTRGGSCARVPDPEDGAASMSPEWLGRPACAGLAPQEAVLGLSGSAVLGGLFHGVMRVVDNPRAKEKPCSAAFWARPLTRPAATNVCLVCSGPSRCRAPLCRVFQS